MNIGKELIPLRAKLPPQAVTKNTSAVSGWVDARDLEQVETILQAGALDGAVATLTFEQAQDDGTGAADANTAKPVTAWTGGTIEADNATVQVDNRTDALDHNDGFTWVRAKVAISNVGSSGLVSMALLGLEPDYSA